MSELVLWPDPRLSEVCDEVPKDMDCRDIVAEMRAVMAKERGIGIAAPQIGEMLRIIVGSGGHGGWDFLLINPTIKKASEQLTWVQEGCLSFPKTCPTYRKDGSMLREGLTVRVRRHKLISMRGYDENWELITVKGRDWMGVCLQHERDHLDGITLENYRSNRV